MQCQGMQLDYDFESTVGICAYDEISGMKLMTTFLMEFENEKLAASFMATLVNILAANGATCQASVTPDKKTGGTRFSEEKDKTSSVDRSYVRAAAACSLLRLAENRNYDKNVWSLGSFRERPI